MKFYLCYKNKENTQEPKVSNEVSNKIEKH